MNCSSPLQRGWTHAWVAADTEFDRAFLSDTEAAGNYPVSSGSRSSINSHRRRPVGPKSQQVSFGRDPAVNEVFCSANTRKDGRWPRCRRSRLVDARDYFDVLLEAALSINIDYRLL